MAAAIALVLSAAVCAGALSWFHRHGFLLYFGDARAHLNIARRIVDSITPGYEQTGTVWLPLPHWAMVPLVSNDAWWQSGLAGGLPAAAANTLACLFLFLTVRRALDCTTAGFVALFLFLTNPNALYLGSIPMTEPYFAACLLALIYFTLRDAPLAAGIAACAGTLVRYEGWFLLPFAALIFARRGLRRGVLFAVVAGLGPLFWLAHNRYFFSDALEFYHGPWSAKAIQGAKGYPGDHDAIAAFRQFQAAARLVAGTPLFWIGAAGAAALAWKRAFTLLGLVLLPPLFYLFSIYSSGTPIFVPVLWPHSYYNTRYGLAALPLLVAGAAAIVAVAPRRIRPFMAAAVLLASAAPWVLTPNKENWICWKESQVNSEAHRKWIPQAAAYLKQHYRGGEILTSFGDITGVYQQAGIPLRNTVHEGNSIYWLAPVYAPERFLRQPWVVATSGDAVATAVLRAQRRGPKYDVVQRIWVKGGPVIEIYRRGSQVRLPQEERTPEEEDDVVIEEQLHP